MGHNLRGKEGRNMMKMPYISGSESKFGKTLDASPQDPQMSDQAKFHGSDL